MSITLIITIIITIILLSMIISAISYSRQQAMKQRKEKIKKYKQEADEIISLLALIVKIDDEYALICALQTIILRTLESAFNLAPEDPMLANSVTLQTNKMALFIIGKRENKINCYATKDDEAAQAVSQLFQTQKILDIYRNKGAIDATTHQSLSNRIKQLKVDFEINTHFHQADVFAQEGDMTMYQMHLKQALDTLKKAPIDDLSKNKRIKDLSDKLNEAKRTNKVVTEPLLSTKQTKQPQLNNDSNNIEPDKTKESHTPNDAQQPQI